MGIQPKGRAQKVPKGRKGVPFANTVLPDPNGNRRARRAAKAHERKKGKHGK